MGSEKRLCDLRVGEVAAVSSVNCDGPSRGRLLELGLLPGTRLSYVRRAPLGDPLVVSLRGYELSLGKRDAQHILVVQESSP